MKLGARRGGVTVTPPPCVVQRICACCGAPILNDGQTYCFPCWKSRCVDCPRNQKPVPPPEPEQKE